MASLINEGSGRRRIEFIDGETRRRIRLGRISERHARVVLHHVEELVSARAANSSVSAQTSEWVTRLDDGFAEKLARTGLIEGRETTALEPFLDAYIGRRRTDLKPLTLKKLLTTRDYLVEFFGASRSLRDITEGDADEWRLHLLAGKGGRTSKAGRRSRTENTVRKHSQVAKQFFTAAVRKRLIRTNPFAALPATVRPNRRRDYFVSREEAERVLEACPDSQWRLLFALSRFGGLRCPSEHLALRWCDVNWETGRIHITSPKTEHHEGKESRHAPLFPELRPYLEDAWDLAPPGEEFVISRYRDTEGNLRTQMLRIIRRAGLQPWPKTFQNLRSTRQTELEERFPSHVVCAWMGNSQSVARKHYLQLTEEHFQQALKGTTPPDGAQKAAQQMRADDMQTSTEVATAQKEPPVVQGDALICADAQNRKIAEEGLEPPTRGL